MSMVYIRKAYGVPAKRGGRVRFGEGDKQRTGTIVGSKGPYLRVRMDGTTAVRNYHPTSEMEYLG